MLLFAGRIEEALADYNEAIRLSPWSPNPVLNRWVLEDEVAIMHSSSCDAGCSMNMSAKICTFCSQADGFWTFAAHWASPFLFGTRVYL